MAKGKLSANNK